MSRDESSEDLADQLRAALAPVIDIIGELATRDRLSYAVDGLIAGLEQLQDKLIDAERERRYPGKAKATMLAEIEEEEKFMAEYSPPAKPDDDETEHRGFPIEPSNN